MNVDSYETDNTIPESYHRNAYYLCFEVIPIILCNILGKVLFTFLTVCSTPYQVLNAHINDNE